MLNIRTKAHSIKQTTQQLTALFTQQPIALRTQYFTALSAQQPRELNIAAHNMEHTTAQSIEHTAHRIEHTEAQHQALSTHSINTQ